MAVILCVQTFARAEDGTMGEMESEAYINLYTHEGRKRLARHSWWAAHNGRAILTFKQPVSRA